MTDYDPHDLKRPRKPRTGLSAEWRLQCQCAKIARQLARQDKSFRFEFINIEGRRDPKRAGILKLMGSEPGTLEVRLYYRRAGNVRMAVADCKSSTGRASPGQQAWLDYYTDTQILGCIVRSVEDFWKMINWVRES